VRHHRLNREPARQPGTHRLFALRPLIDPVTRKRRAYSLIEVAIALAVFGMLAGFVTVAIARAQLGALGARFEREARGVMTSMVDQVATGDTLGLVDGSFSRPNPCSDDALSSCIEVQGRSLVVRWRSDVTVVSGVPSSVRLDASTELPDTRTISAARTIVVPPGFSTTVAQLRVRTSGISYSGALHLVTAGGTSVGAAIVSDGVALISAPASSCTTTKPCRVALTPSGGWAVGEAVTGDAVTIDATTAVGSAGRVTLDATSITETSVVLRRGASLDVKLLAVNGDGRRAFSSELGSICLWASFADGVDDRVVSACNTELADRVTFERYAPNPDVPDRTVLIPTQTSLTLHTDRPSGGCPAVQGQLGWTTNGWANATVCTSHTWGRPATILVGATTTTFEGAVVTLNAARSSVTASWSGVTARPAAGYEGEPLWGKPRNLQACSSSKTCTPVVTAPEATACPDQHCRSDRNFRPRLTAPAVGSLQVPTVTRTGSQPVAFTLSFADSDAGDDATTAIALVSAPSAGILSVGGVTITGARSLGSFVGKTGSVDVVYTPAGTGSDLDTFVVRAQDARGGSTSTTLGISSGVVPWAVVAEPTAARQGGTATFATTVYGSDGEPMSGVSVSAGAPAGTVGTQASPTGTHVTSAGGSANPTLLLDTIRAGRYNVAVSATAGDVTRSSPVALLVLGSPAQLELTAASVGQGAASVAAVTVRDRAGDPLAGVLVDFDISNGSGSSVSVRPKPGACITTGDGRCSVLIAAAADASSGTYTLTATAGASGNVAAGSTITSTRAFTVTSVAQRLVPADAKVTQSRSKLIDVRLTDGAGTPVAGVTVVGSGPTGLTFTSAVTDAKGVARVSVSATATVAAGVKNVVFTAGDVTVQGIVRVLGKVDDVIAEDIEITQGSAVAVSLKIVDVNGARVPDRVLTFSAGDLLVSSQVTTDAYGIARIAVTAPMTAAAGTRVISVLESGDVVGGFDVDVVTGVASITAFGKLAKGTSGTLKLQLRDATGAVIVGLPVTVVSPVSSVRITGSATTGDDGVADVPVTVSADALSGIVTFIFDTGYRIIKVGVVVQ